MPKGRPNSYAGGGFIQSMREKHEPHMKLAGKVESLEKNIPIEFAGIHKTISKSFGMQRKTLARVLGLENRVSNIETGVEIWTEREALRRQKEAEQAAKKAEQEAAQAAEQAAKEAAKEVEQAKKEAEKAEQAAQEVIEEVEEVIEEVEEVIEDELDGEIPEGLDDVLDDIRGEEKFDAAHATPEEVEEYNSSVSMTDEEKEFVGEESKFDVVDKSVSTKTKPKSKKKRPRIKIKKKNIPGSAFKKGTPFDEGYASRVMGQDEKGEYLSKEERIRRFKGEPLAKPDDLKPGDAETPVAAEVDGEKSQEGLLPILKSISSSVDGIKETLIGQAEVSKDQTEFVRKSQENKKRNKRESGLEKMAGGVKKVGQMALKPVMGIWDKIVNFLTAILFGSTVVKLWEWFSDPTNKDKVSSLFKFIKDWWPLLVAGIMAFVGPGMIFVAGAIALLSWGIPKIVDAVKSIFGFGDKVDKELAKGEADSLKDSEKLEAGMDGELKAQLDDKQQNSEQPPDLKKTEQAAEDTKKETGRLGMNKGGEVPGTGDKDTVPAMLTPGEFVMSKGAVQEYGVQTLEGMNAAAGGTNIPTLQKKDKKGGKGGKVGSGLMPRYSGGGKAESFDKSHYGTEGYQIGQVNPPTLVVSQEKFEEKIVTKNGEIVDDKSYEKFSEMTASIGVPDLMEHQGQLLGEINKVPGYENINIQDVVNKKVNMPLDQYLPILMNSDAQKATFAKWDAAHQADLQLRGITDPSKGYSMGYNGGGLVQGFAGGGLVPAFNGGGLVQGYRGGGLIRGLGKLIKRSRDVGGSVLQSALKMSGVQNMGSNVAPPGTPVGGKVRVVAIPGGVPGGSTPPADNSGKKIPAFSASAKNSQRKIKTLGISL